MTSAGHGTFPLRLLGAVICGGRSQRMGRDKSSLMHATGLTYLEHATARLLRCCQTVVHCVGFDSPSKDQSIPVVRDRRENRGPVEAVAGALQFAMMHHYVGCLVTAVDLPNLSGTDLQQLVDRFVTDPQSITIAMGSDNRLQPLVAIYPVAWLDAVDKLALAHDRSLMRFLECQPIQKVLLPDKALHNVNTPDDL